MTNFYIGFFKFYYKDELISSFTNRTLADEKNIQNQKIYFTWDNLKENYSKYGIFLPFNIWQFKKGQVIAFFNSMTIKHIKDIKEWKTKQLDNMYMTVEFKEDNPPLSVVLNWFDSEKAIQYLMERGLKM